MRAHARAYRSVSTAWMTPLVAGMLWVITCALFTLMRPRKINQKISRQVFVKVKTICICYAQVTW